MALLALPFAVGVVVAATLASVPLVPSSLLPSYLDAAQHARVAGITYQELVAADAVRFRQDFSRVTPETIQHTLEFFTHCWNRKNPDTGQEESVCERRSFEEVMTAMGFTEADKEQARKFLAFNVGGSASGYTFQPAGPYTWPISAYRITSDFGPRIDPVTFEESYHTGVDIAADVSTPVEAAATGKVIEAGEDGNYGLMVRVDHGGFTTGYGHLSQITVDVGEYVAAGWVIGYSGNTGKSTGPHLHFEWIVEDVPENPLLHYGH